MVLRLYRFAILFIDNSNKSNYLENIEKYENVCFNWFKLKIGWSN